ncbi:hypothetical protein RJ641_033815 [Dillenia turbinata]|uniref:Uncharacterized protein n=1 Tax=Dillenia turbinata TaxID=194707 RepID=A0AAN8VMI2_9MAGN
MNCKTGLNKGPTQQQPVSRKCGSGLSPHPRSLQLLGCDQPIKASNSLGFLLPPLLCRLQIIIR